MTKNNQRLPSICLGEAYLGKSGITFQRQIWQTVDLGKGNVCSLLVRWTGQKFYGLSSSPRLSIPADESDYSNSRLMTNPSLKHLSQNETDEA